MRYESGEVPGIIRSKRNPGTHRGGCDKAVGPRDSFAAGEVKYVRRSFSLNRAKSDNPVLQNSRGIKHLLSRNRAGQKFAPGDCAGRKFFTGIDPCEDLRFQGRARRDQTHNIIGIKVDHLRRRSDSCLVRRISASNLAAALGEIPFPSRRIRRKISSGVSCLVACAASSETSLTARRITSDLGTPHAVANSCTRSTVSGFRE